MSTIIDSLKIVLGIDAKGVQTGGDIVKYKLRELDTYGQRTFASLKGAIAGYFTAEAFVGLARGGFELADRITELSKRFGVNTDEVQKLDKAAKKVGLTFEDVGSSLDKFGAFLSEAAKDKTGKKLDMLNAYGLTKEDVDAFEDGSRRVIDIATKMNVPLATSSKARQDFREMFGKGGGQFLSVLNEARDMGPMELITDKQLEKLHEAKELLTEMHRILLVKTAGGIADMLQGVNEQSATRLVSRMANQAWFGLKNLTGAGQGLADWITLLRGTARTDRSVSHRWQDWGTDRYGDQFAAQEGAPGGNEAAYYRKQMADEVAKMLFKSANKGEKRTLIPRQMEALLRRADALDAEGKRDEAYALRKEAAGMSGELAGAMMPAATRPTADTLAAIGGYVGGAVGATDPSLFVQQSQLEVQREILRKVGIIAGNQQIGEVG